MIPKPVIVSGLLLVVAVLAFAGLGYQQVPMSTTKTVGQTSTQVEFSYSPFLGTNTVAYSTITTTIPSTSLVVGATTGCYGPNCYYTAYSTIGYCYSSSGLQWSYCGVYCYTPAISGVLYVCYAVKYTSTVDSTYEAQDTATIPYSQTLTSSVTKSSTSLVPASAALGLTDGSFTVLAVVVIGVLALLTAYAALKPRTTHGPTQATPSQFVKAPTSCIKCGAELPPASTFCKSVGQDKPDEDFGM